MKKNRKDIFRKAVADDLREQGGEASDLGEFVSDMKNTRAGEDSPNENHSAEDKNGLPHQNADKETEKIMESRLKRLTAGESQPAAFADDDEPPRWRKFAVYGVVAALLLLIIYWTFFTTSSRAAVYLSSAPIEETNIRNLSSTNLTFPKNKTVYLFFTAGGRMGQDKVIVKLTEVYTDSSNMTKEESVSQIEGTVKANWRYFSTQFQKENFDHAGRFRVHVFSPNGEVIATQEFRVQ